MADKNKDQFANYAIVSVTESAANTLTFKKLETGISITEKVAWIINRIEYFITALNGTYFNAAGDLLYWGVSLTNSWTTPAASEITILDYNSAERVDLGAAASGAFVVRPILKDFSAMPSGGIIVPPSPLYIYGMGSGLTAAATVVARIHYTTLVLSVDQYWELVEARRVLTS